MKYRYEPLNQFSCASLGDTRHLLGHVTVDIDAIIQNVSEEVQQTNRNGTFGLKKRVY